MDSPRWEQIQSFFHQALQLRESDREAFLAAACGPDLELRAELRTMLQADGRKASLLDRGLADVAFQFVGNPLDSISTREFGPYRLKKLLGEGGMGVVWLAERADAGNLVAIKFLPHAGLSPARRERFAREIKTLAKLTHPFIGRLYDAGTLDDGTPWFVMEYVNGMPFTEYCKGRNRPIEEQFRLFRMVCDAVRYAHGQEIIHRDLKPSNILVEPDGTPRLLDFGIARQLQNFDDPTDQTRQGLRLMSPEYAAPEWIRDGNVGFYTDVYSLGVILYEMLTGRRPINRSKRTPEGAMNSAIGQQPEKPSIAANHSAEATEKARVWSLSKAAWSDLDVLCLKAIHQDPGERYQSVEALVRDIDHYTKREPLEARPDAFGYRTGKFLRRNHRAVIASAAVLALVAGLIIFYTVRLARTRDAAIMQATRAQRIQRFMLSLFGGDRNAAPADALRVVTILDRGIQEAQILRAEPAVQSELYETLGGIYLSLGKLDRAESLLGMGLEKQRSAFGPDSAETAFGLMELSTLRLEQAKFDEAERLAREAIAIDRRKLASDDPELGKALSTLGVTLEHRGSLNEAGSVLREAVRVQSTPKAETADLVESLTYLSDTEHILGHDAVANSLAQRVLAFDRSVYGNDHPSVAEDLSNLGSIKEGLGQYQEAEQSERQAVAITEKWYGRDNAETALEWEAVGKTLVCERKYAEATKLLQQALATQERLVGKDHPYVGIALNSLGVAALKQGRLDEAEADFRRLAEIYRSAYGAHDIHVAVPLLRFGELYVARKQFSRAEQQFQEAARRFSQAFSADNLRTGIARIELGGALLREQHYREAEEHLLAGYHIVTSQGHALTEEAMDARRDLVSLYEAMKMPEKASKFKVEIAANEPKQDAAVSEGSAKNQFR